MKKVLLVLSVLLIGCTTYQPIASVDPIYGYTTNTIENEFELQRLLRTDFKFRYDFAQFAIRQPLTWQWSNRIFRYGFNRYNYWNPYYKGAYIQSYDYTQMWNDWLWGMNSTYWWNNNQNNWYNGPYANIGYNVIYNSSRRTSENTIENRIVDLQDTNKRRVKPKVKPIVIIPTYNNKPIILNKNNNIKPPIISNPRPSINRNSRPNRRITPPTVKKRGG